MKVYNHEVQGTYGSNQTPCTVFVYPTNGGAWYAAEGAQTVNFTHDEIEEGVDIEELKDSDCFTWSKEIETLEELEQAVEA